MENNRFSFSTVMLAVVVVAAAFLLKVMIYTPADETEAVHEAAEKPATKKHVQKPTPGEILQLLKAGNERFTSGTATHPHANAERVALAGKESQGDHALATVITCSDSRVPVELIFDAGIMDMFVIRIAGNVFDVDEAGSPHGSGDRVEYRCRFGLADADLAGKAFPAINQSVAGRRVHGCPAGRS